jgi:hypothetical protein
MMDATEASDITEAEAQILDVAMSDLNGWCEARVGEGIPRKVSYSAIMVFAAALRDAQKGAMN